MIESIDLLIQYFFYIFAFLIFLIVDLLLIIGILWGIGIGVRTLVAKLKTLLNIEPKV